MSWKGGDEGGKEEEESKPKQALQRRTHQPLDTPLISGFLTYFCSLNRH
jgi:hypothetical protein